MNDSRNKAIHAKKEEFKRLKYPEYEKLSGKDKETYNQKEREYNFNRKMAKKGFGATSNKLNKFFSNIK